MLQLSKTLRPIQARPAIPAQGNTRANNVAQAPSDALRASGGAIYLATTTITLTANTLRQNSAPFGAGLSVFGAGQNQITANTLITDTATQDGGGAYLQESAPYSFSGNVLRNNGELRNNDELRVAGTSQLAYFNKSVTVRGGYSPNNWEMSSPATQPAVLDARGLGRVVRVTNGVIFKLADLTVINGSVVGLGGAGNLDAGGNIFVDGAQFILDNFTVVNGQAAIGKVVIGAPTIDSEATRFSNGVVLLFDQSSATFDFTAIGPDLVTISPASGLALFSIRIFNRGARTDTFVISPLTTPTGWTVSNLPSTVTLRPFRSSLAFVVLAIPTDQVISAIDRTLSIVISSQNDAGNHVIVPLRIVSQQEGYRIRLPRISR